MVNLKRSSGKFSLMVISKLCAEYTGEYKVKLTFSDATSPLLADLHQHFFIKDGDFFSVHIDDPVVMEIIQYPADALPAGANKICKFISTQGHLKAVLHIDFICQAKEGSGNTTGHLLLELFNVPPAVFKFITTKVKNDLVGKSSVIEDKILEDL